MKTFAANLPAGGTITPQIAGKYVRVTKATGAVRVRTSQGVDLTLELGLGVGFAEPFESLEIYSATAQQIELAVGFGQVDDNRLVGTVNLTGGLSTAEVRGATHTASAVTVGTSAVQLEAADANRKNLIIQAISGDIFIGGANTVTVANGLKIAAGGSFETQGVGAVWAIAASAGVDVREWKEVV